MLDELVPVPGRQFSVLIITQGLRVLAYCSDQLQKSQKLTHTLYINIITVGNSNPVRVVNNLLGEGKGDSVECRGEEEEEEEEEEEMREREREREREKEKGLPPPPSTL